MKLTKTIKENIIDKAVTKTMQAYEDAYTKRKHEFGELLYNLMYSEIDQQKMQALPDGWLPTSSSLRISLSDGSCDVRANMSDYKKVLAVDNNYRSFDGSSWTLGTKRKVRKIEAELNEAYKAKRDKEQQLGRALRQLIMPCTTLKKLREVWPEGEEFFTSEPEFTANLPAVRATAVNEMIAAIRGEKQNANG